MAFFEQKNTAYVSFELIDNSLIEKAILFHQQLRDIKAVYTWLAAE